MPITCYQFWSSGKRFGLLIERDLIERILHECVKECGNETGGILMGYYTDQRDCAVVTDISGPPKDSIHSRMSFYRGIHGLQPWISRMWQEKRHYYLGEWHCHPGCNAIPSPDDNNQMRGICEDKKTKCPEPILLIVGGDPLGCWDIRSYVYSRDKEYEEIVQQKD